MKKSILLLPSVLFMGCFQTFNDDAELRTVPVTNNPNIIPSHGSLIPGMGESAPY